MKPTSQKAPHTRKRLLIQPKFQTSFIAGLNLISLSIIVVFYVALNLSYRRFERLGAAADLPANHVFYEFLHQQEAMMNHVFLITAAISSCALLVLGLILSNKIAGPIERMKDHLDQVVSGETESELQFRAGDYVDDLPDRVNRLIREFLRLKREKK